jgi:hypothetical protein
MGRARRHPRAAAAAAFGLLALVAEIAGRSLTERIDVGRHVAAPGYADAAYYPFLLVSVKLGVALLLARLTWRFARARATARTGRRLLARLGRSPAQSVPRVRVTLSPRLWLAAFALTSLVYLAQTDVEQISAGHWPILAPWLHTSALSVFAVLAVVVALVWSAVAGWLNAYERYAEATIAHARRLAARGTPRSRWRTPEPGLAPRRLFGIAFESRPPPVPA